MAKKANIRAVDIADALDQDLGDVSRALRPLVDVGNVDQHSGLGPSGAPSQLYNLSDAFKQSLEYATVLAIVNAEKRQEPAPAAAPQVPVFGEVTKLPKSKSHAQVAIEHLTVHQPVTDKDMHIVLGIDHGTRFALI